MDTTHDTPARQPMDEAGSQPVFEPTRLFEGARLALARLDVSSADTLRDLWLQLAQIATDALRIDRERSRAPAEVEVAEHLRDARRTVQHDA